MPTVAPQTDTHIEAASPPESSRDRIIVHSLSLFSARGYHGVSMNDIAQSVGITKAALYYHFDDKESLFIEAVRRKTATLAHELEPIITSDLALDVLLKRVALFLLDDGLGEYRQLQSELLTIIEANRRKACLQEIQRLMHLLVTRIEYEQASGNMARDMDVEMAVSLFFSMIGGQIRRFALGTAERPTPTSHDTMADLIVRIWLHGVQPHSHGEAH